MISIEDTEKLITAMRAQARALEAGADSLEAALAPMKAAQANIEQWNAASKMFFDFWQGKGLLTDLQKPNKLDIKV